MLFEADSVSIVIYPANGMDVKYRNPRLVEVTLVVKMPYYNVSHENPTPFS